MCICVLTFIVEIFVFQLCCACNLRGGALKRTTCGQWCHMVCALGITDIKFDDVVNRSGINLCNVTSARRKLVKICADKYD